MFGMWKVSLPGKLSLEEETWWLEHRRSTLRVGIIHGFAALVKGPPYCDSLLSMLAYTGKKKKKPLPASLRGFLSTVLKVFNFIRARVLNHCLLKKSVKRWKEYTKFVSLHRSLPTFQSTRVPKPFWTLNKNIQEKASLSSQQFRELLGGLTYLQVFLVVKWINSLLFGPVTAILNHKWHKPHYFVQLNLKKRNLEVHSYIDKCHKKYSFQGW